MKTLLQVALGIAFTIAVAVAVIYSSLPLFWEPPYPDDSYPITWRSGLLFLAVLAIMQWVASLVVRKTGRRTQSSQSS